MRLIGEQPSAIRNHRRNLSGDRRQPYEFPIDPEQRVLERRAITQLTAIFRAIVDNMSGHGSFPTAQIRSRKESEGKRSSLRRARTRSPCPSCCNESHLRRGRERGCCYSISSGTISNTSILTACPSCVAGRNCHCCNAVRTNWALEKGCGKTMVRSSKRPD